MKKLNFKMITMSLVSAMIVVGCGSGSKTYVDEGPATPDTPTEGNVLVVTASDEATGVITYTEVGDGSVLVECGDGDNYNCEVSLAVEEDKADGGASTTGEGSCEAGYSWCPIDEKCVVSGDSTSACS